MQFASLRSVFFVVALSSPLLASGAEQQSLQCDVGPVKKTYGKTQWLVYSCSDGKTVVVASDTGNPAMPFYFTFHPKQGGYQLHGEGTGSKEATAAAFDDLKNMTESDIKTLIAEAMQINERKKAGKYKSP